MKHHVQLVTILANSAFQSNAQYIHSNARDVPVHAEQCQGTALKSRIRQDRDQLYMVFHTCMYRYMSVYVGTIL